ncbi:hypothetical protein CACET_c38900 [Clostridium aceticum]|uniref:Uncharacterized protein n=1 Tax=Clostridium aceticum TaxID=84022 RepID=A0A0D8I7W3_9CLOT|nr:hypothetical protein [Clostridium aceticum]AKL97318.1 hypothetical protein CACET_c38900 [Clostridium aceticum]KJF26333.1 hypothetical protein TZ02_14300 [Clostridium aceticum]
MPWQMTMQYLINQPVGVSLADGTGVSGILCSITHSEIYLLEYLYHTQFALKRYPLYQIRDVLPFPPCSTPISPLY